MVCTAWYPSPLGRILLAGDAQEITGLWFEAQKYFPRIAERQNGGLPVLEDAKAWLDCYFSGQEPGFAVPVRPEGTPFQREVWALLQTIPYGETTTYGALAARLAAGRGTPKMSARAVGSAVGRNPISILIPCHRVVGAGGSLTGYAGGLERKRFLLELEGLPLPQK